MTAKPTLPQDPGSRAPGQAEPARASIVGLRAAPPPTPTLLELAGEKTLALFEHMGHIATILGQATVAMFKRPLELESVVYQMESLGVKSLGIAAVTAVFIGMVMAVQFAFGLQKFGGMEYTGRIIGLSFSRELAPSLTAVIVGGRIGSGMTAELGAMAVTEQIDAIRALGADPIKKLVVPRLIASTIIMPILAVLALVLGFSGAMLVTSTQFNIPAGFFLRTALGSVGMGDFFSGVCKAPFFGAIIALVGCYFGLTTHGGTEGVGKATTKSVVVISISILIADFLLTKLFMAIWTQ